MTREPTPPSTWPAASPDPPATSDAESDLDPGLPQDLAAASERAAPLSESVPEAEAPKPAASEPDAVLPAPYVEREPPRFWRRIRLGRTRRMAREEARDGHITEIEQRLSRIEARISSIDQGLGLRFDRMEQRFLQLWEMEEQLGQLRDISDRLDEVRRSQREVTEAAKGLPRNMRTTSLILALAVLGLAAALAGLLWAA